MGLTGLPLLLAAVGATSAALVGLALLWPRLYGWWRLARVGGVLVCQLLMVITVGLAVNRSDAFYPSWAALLGSGSTRISTQRQVAAMDHLLAAQRASGQRSGLALVWQGQQIAGWHLRAAPEVLLPRAYFQQPTRVQPVILAVIGPDPGSTRAWDNARLAKLTAAGPAVVVLIRPQPGPLNPTIGTVLPDRLTRDLRVLPGGWGLVGVGDSAAAMVDLFGHAPARFGSLALLGPQVGRVGPRARQVAGARLVAFPRTDDPTVVLPWLDAELPPALAPPLVVTSTRAGPLN